LEKILHRWKVTGDLYLWFAEAASKKGAETSRVFRDPSGLCRKRCFHSACSGQQEQGRSASGSLLCSMSLMAKLNIGPMVGRESAKAALFYL